MKQKLATIQATVSGIVATSANCIEMFEEREQFWQEQIAAVSFESYTFTYFDRCGDITVTDIIDHRIQLKARKECASRVVWIGD